MSQMAFLRQRSLSKEEKNTFTNTKEQLIFKDFDGHIQGTFQTPQGASETCLECKHVLALPSCHLA